MKIALGAGTALVAALALTAPAGAACIKLGVYQDNVAKTLVAALEGGRARASRRCPST